MDNLSKDVQKHFEDVWDPNGAGQYRLGSPGQRLAPLFVSYVLQGATVNEYGSGTGRPAVAIRKLRPDIGINMIDIARNALEPEASGMIGTHCTFTLASLWGLPERFPVADWGYCIDVLMCVEPSKLDAILAEIRRTCDNLFTQVYDWDDIRLGVNYTTIVKSPEWWLEKFREYWPTVERVQSKEHQRRYIFICRGPR